MAYSNKKKNEGNIKIEIGLTPEIIDNMIIFVLSDSPLVNLKSIVNLNNLINRISFSDDVFENRFKFDLLKNLLMNEVENHMFNYAFLRDAALKQFPEYSDIVDAVLSEAAESVISEEDIMYLNEYVEQRLTYFYLFENKDNLKNALDALELSDNMDEVNNKFTKVIGNLYKAIQNSSAVKQDSATDFCIGGSDGNFKNKNLDTMVKKTIDDLNKPSNFVKTGIKQLNAMLGGGYENGRAYLVYAPPKSWKSGFLLNSGIWACKYNEFKTKDPEKTPCVLYVTMENTAKETISRLYTHITGQNIKSVDYSTASKVINDYLTTDENGNRKDIAFEIRYRKNKSISTVDLDAMIDELKLEGKEVVLLIQDYIKRIRSAENNPDLRLELGEITNDFVSLARTRDIPVISAAQINRMGIKKIEDAIGSQKGNLAKIIDKSDAGESALPLENIDYAFAITPEESANNPSEKFLGFKLWVSRGDKSDTTFFLHPFENGMKLEEDLLYDSSTSIDTLNLQEVKNNSFTAEKAMANRGPNGVYVRKAMEEIPDDGTEI